METYTHHHHRSRHPDYRAADHRPLRLPSGKPRQNLPTLMRWALAALASIVFIVSAVAPVGAIQHTAYNGLVVSPAIKQLSLTPGQDSTTFSTQVTNDSASPMTIQ